METILKEEVLLFQLTENPLNNTQHGFLPSRSCVTNLLTYLEYVTKNIDDGKPVDVIYLDFKKAFDNVPHRRLLVRMGAMG